MNNLQVFFTIYVISIGFNIGLLYIAEKWEIIKWYELNRKSWMPKKCYFCLLFWISCIEFSFIIFDAPGISIIMEIIMIIVTAISLAAYSYSIMTKGYENH